MKRIPHVDNHERWRRVVILVVVVHDDDDVLEEISFYSMEMHRINKGW